MGKFFCGLGGVLLVLVFPAYLAMLALADHHLTGQQPLGFGLLAAIISFFGFILLYDKE